MNESIKYIRKTNTTCCSGVERAKRQFLDVNFALVGGDALIENVEQSKLEEIVEQQRLQKRVY